MRGSRVFAGAVVALLALTGCGANATNASVSTDNPLGTVRTSSAPKTVFASTGISLTCDDGKVRKLRSRNMTSSVTFSYKKGPQESCKLGLNVRERKAQGTHQQLILVMATPENVYTSDTLQGNINAKSIRFPDDSTLVVLVQDAFQRRGDLIQRDTEEPDSRALQAVRSKVFQALTK